MFSLQGIILEINFHVHICTNFDVIIFRYIVLVSEEMEVYNGELSYLATFPRSRMALIP